MCALVSLPTVIILARAREDKTFLLRLFLLGVLVRLIVGTIIYVGHMEEFFGGDANTYHMFGASLVQSWHGNEFHDMAYDQLYFVRR